MDALQTLVITGNGDGRFPLLRETSQRNARCLRDGSTAVGRFLCICTSVGRRRPRLSHSLTSTRGRESGDSCSYRGVEALAGHRHRDRLKSRLQTAARFTSSCTRGLIGLVVILVVTLMSSCAGVPAKADLRTSLNSMGGGQHEMTLTVPVEVYSAQIFDRLPDFSVITGVRLLDYQGAGRQGLRITQNFYRLERLNANPESAHFLNRAFSGSPVAFRAQWRPGLITRDLEMTVFVNTAQSNALQAGVAAAALGLSDARFTLRMPGRITQHNGAVIDERTVAWRIDPAMPQTFTATAQVLSVPAIVALVFNVGVSLLLLAQTISGRSGPSGSVSSGGASSSGTTAITPRNSAQPGRPTPPRRR
jgi:hypothetical protein